jgi:exopolysaccharide biosynthesis polyprenyl glycosylphosphotransferase
MGSTVQKSNAKALPKIDFRVVHDIVNAGQSQQWRWLMVGMILLDLLMIAAGFILAYVIRFRMNIPFFFSAEEGQGPSLRFYITLGALLIPLWIAIFAFTGLYSRQNILGGAREYALVFNATTIAMFVVISANFLIPQFILARGWLLLTWFFVFFFTASGRFWTRRLIYMFRARGYFLTPTMIVGANEESRLLAEQFQNQRASGLKVVGCVANNVPAGTEVYGDVHVLGNLSQLVTLSREKNVEEVIVTTSAVSADDILQVFKLYGMADGVTLRLSSGLYEIITTGLQIQELASVPLVKVNKIRLTGVDQVLKTVMDYGIALLSMLVVIPLSVVIGIIIKVDSKGPVFHRRRVMGMNGRAFDAFKFRTMLVDGDEILESRPDLKEELAREHKLKDDPRITRVGKILRKLSLDEISQAFNVLRGEMSIVGPRMISPEEMEKYQQLGMNLLTVKPGITGLWQVSGRSDVSYEQRVRLDMYYIRNWSIWLDLQIILRTIPAILSRRGAY